MTKDAYIRCESRTNHAVLARFASIRRLSTPLSLVRINSTILKLTPMGASPVPTFTKFIARLLRTRVQVWFQLEPPAFP